MLIVLAFVLLIFLPTPWNLWCFAAGLVLGIGELFFWNRTVKNRRPATGAQTLIGAEGVALSVCRPHRVPPLASWNLPRCVSTAPSGPPSVRPEWTPVLQSGSPPAPT